MDKMLYRFTLAVMIYATVVVFAMLVRIST